MKLHFNLHDDDYCEAGMRSHELDESLVGPRLPGRRHLLARRLTQLLFAIRKKSGKWEIIDVVNFPLFRVPSDSQQSNISLSPNPQKVRVIKKDESEEESFEKQEGKAIPQKHGSNREERSKFLK